MIQPINFTRAGIQYELFKGIENGLITLFIQEVEQDADSLRTRWILVSLYSRLTSIKTEWRKVKVSSAGNEVGVSELVEMNSKPSDVATFNTIFGPNILSFMANGFIRDVKGFNHLPIIDTRPTVEGIPNTNFGLPMVYTEFQESTEPTWDYSTWNTGDPLPESIIEPIIEE